MPFNAPSRHHDQDGRRIDDALLHNVMFYTACLIGNTIGRVSFPVTRHSSLSGNRFCASDHLKCSNVDIAKRIY